MIPVLQSLRFVFVMMIVMSHFAYKGYPSFEAGGDCGVAFFFVLSGFVLSLGYGRQLDNGISGFTASGGYAAGAPGTFHYGTFMRRRLLKIFPLHLLCLVLFLVLFHAKETIDGRLVLNVLLLQSWIPDDNYYFSYNGVSWFLSCLLFLYAVFPLAYRKAGRLMLAIVLLLCLVAYVLVPYDRVNSILYVNPLMRFVDFFLGIMLSKVYLKLKDRPATFVWAEVGLTLLLVLLLMAYPYADEKLRNAPLYWLVLLPLVVVFACQRGPVSRLLLCRPLQWLGALSMPIFLIHPIVFRSLFHFFPAVPYMLMLTVSLVVIVALSWTVDRFFLRPVERLRRVAT